MSDHPLQFPKPPGGSEPAEAAKPDKAPATEKAGEQRSVGKPAIPSKPRESSAPSRLLVGVVAGFAGAVAGYLVGAETATRPAIEPIADATATTRPIATSSAPKAEKRSVSAEPGGTSEIGLDMGSPDPRVTLAGPWSDVQLGARTAGRLGFSASLATVLAPTGDAYGLAVVARVDEGVLDVGVRVNQKDAGKWRVTKDWDMHALVLDADSLRSGVNTFEFVLPPGPEGRPVAMVIDTLHLGPLQMRAHADLAGANAHGALIDGYYGREGQGEQAQTWSAGNQTRIGLMMKPLNADYEVELRGAAFGPLQPLGVEARINGTSVGKVKVDKDTSYGFRVPPSTLTTGFNLLTLVYDKTLKPSQTDPKSKDQRELAIRISRVTIKPRTTQ